MRPILSHSLKLLAKQVVDIITPARLLRLLFRLDNVLYTVQSRLAVQYGNGVHTKQRHMRYYDFFVKRVQAGEHVLDIGCGIGAVARQVAERSQAQVTGMDLEMRNIRQAVQLNAHPQVSYINGDALSGFLASKFDVIILSNVLEHLPERPAFLRRVQQTAQPSRYLIRVPLFERDWRVPLKRELGVDWRLDPTHETEYTLETFAAEMAAANLEITYLEVRWSEIWAEIKPQEHRRDRPE